MSGNDTPTFAQFFAEAFGRLDAPWASASRQHAFARFTLLLVVPLVLLPTGLRHFTSAPQGYAPAAATFVLWIWVAFAIVFVLGLGLVLGVRGVGRTARLGTNLGILGLIGTNAMSMLAVGSLTSWGALYVACVIASTRVFLDYGHARFATALGTLGLMLGVGLELGGVIPLASFAPAPPGVTYYDDPAMAILTAVVADVTLILTFGAVNYGMNQSHKLHRYITWSVLARYLPPSMVARAADGELRLDDPPERRVVTVLFTDLVGFTAMTERLGAASVSALLNRYLSDMSALAHEHGATVDKFVGDAVMLVYGAPEPMPPEQQVREAIALARAMIAHTAKLPGERLELRAGLETGEVVVGNFGSQTRSDYTVIGSVVNVAARLESAAKPGQIYVGPGAASEVGSEGLVEVGELTLKGIAAPVRAWQVTDPA